MKPVNPHDQSAVKEIKQRQQKMKDIIYQASVKEAAKLPIEALHLYFEARHLSIYVGDELKIKIMTEYSDQENWHQLNNKIEALQRRLNSYE